MLSRSAMATRHSRLLTDGKTFDLAVDRCGPARSEWETGRIGSTQSSPKLRILFVTGYAAGVTQRKELVVDGSDMLLKPFTINGSEE
jgi:hypothetical protein